MDELLAVLENILSELEEMACMEYCGYWSRSISVRCYLGYR